MQDKIKMNTKELEKILNRELYNRPKKTNIKFKYIMDFESTQINVESGLN